MMMPVKSKPIRRVALPKDALTLGVLSLFVIVAVCIAVVLFNLVRDTVASWSLTNLPGEPIAAENQPMAGPGTQAPNVVVTAPSGALQPESGPTPQPWDGVSRVTILVLGLDARDWDTIEGKVGEPSRTDSMWLMTIDPLSKTAGMLSIPRDLWVNIPDGFGYNKINQAYFFGDAYKLPGGGPALAVKTVEQFLGVPINYYAQIDFSAFVNFVDDIKGVKIYIEEPMTIETIGNHEVKLEPGWVTLPGDIALAYARDRHNPFGDKTDDFARSERQKQVILGIRQRILDFNMLPDLIANAPTIYKDLASGVHTNLNLQQIIQLALLVKDIPNENIHQRTIGADMVIQCNVPECSTDLLKPIMDKIRIARDEVFTTGGPVSPATVSEDPAELMKMEKARISVRNATSTAGLASRTSDYFKTLGLDVVEETNAELTVTSMLIDYTGKPYTLAYLADLMGVPNSRIYNRYDPNSTVDIAVVLGADWANTNPMP
jgi:LCP family protein required for cell wall assembly